MAEAVAAGAPGAHGQHVPAALHLQQRHRVARAPARPCHALHIPPTESFLANSHTLYVLLSITDKPAETLASSPARAAPARLQARRAPGPGERVQHHERAVEQTLEP